MRFHQHLTETHIFLPNEIHEINNIITDSCKQYLKLIKNRDPLYRGISVNDDNGIKRVRTDRKNHGYLTRETFKKFNDWLQLSGNNRRDDTVICTSNKKWAETFGSKVYYVFPMGDISYTWMDAKDFNRPYRETGWSHNSVDTFLQHLDDNTDFDTAYGDKMQKPFHKYFHTDVAFDMAYDKGYEMWIKCRAYYYVSTENTDIVYDKKYQVFV